MALLDISRYWSSMCLCSCHIVCLLPGPTVRYWCSDVSSGGGGASVSVDGLHRLARQRAAARQSIGKQKEQEDTEPLAWDEDGEDTEPLAWDEDGGDTEPVAWDEDGGDTEPVAWDEDGEDTEEGQGEADCSVPMETEIGEKLLPVTHTIKSSLPVGVRAKHPAWISQPRLVERDIVSASAALTSVPLPPIIICNLRSMGCTSLFPVQVMVVLTLMYRIWPCSLPGEGAPLTAVLLLPTTSRCVCLCPNWLWKDPLLCCSHGYSTTGLCCLPGM